MFNRKAKKKFDSFDSAFDSFWKNLTNSNARAILQEKAVNGWKDLKLYEKMFTLVFLFNPKIAMLYFEDFKKDAKLMILTLAISFILGEILMPITLILAFLNNID